ncbi:MAG TPA: DUF1761 domain-containing protein [Lysobacter sp.]|nr:DUF1761 domain-containing protein [Lysobacter sp.]
MELTWQAVHWPAVIAAAASAFVLGGVWYGPLFKQVWCREAGIDPDAPAKRHPGGVFAVAGLCSLLAALVFAALLPPQASVATATALGALTGAGWVAMSFGINYAFAGRSLALWAIDAGYHLLQFTLYGLILGLWR